jgi:hypothetical protein
MFTPYQELDALLADLVREVRDILGDTFVGAYLQGSFALGAGDPRPGSMEATYAFAAHVESLARGD